MPWRYHNLLFGMEYFAGRPTLPCSTPFRAHLYPQPLGKVQLLDRQANRFISQHYESALRDCLSLGYGYMACELLSWHYSNHL
jgi:hypothetical protein